MLLDLRLAATGQLTYLDCGILGSQPDQCLTDARVMVRRGQDRNVWLLGLRCDAHSKNDYLLALKRDLVQISAAISTKGHSSRRRTFSKSRPRATRAARSEKALVYHKKDDFACALDQRLVTTLSMSK